MNCLLAGFPSAEIQKMNVHMTIYLNFPLEGIKTIARLLYMAHGREGNGNCHYLCATTVTLFRLSCLFLCSA